MFAAGKTRDPSTAASWPPAGRGRGKRRVGSGSWWCRFGFLPMEGSWNGNFSVGAHEPGGPGPLCAVGRIGTGRPCRVRFHTGSRQPTHGHQLRATSAHRPPSFLVAHEACGLLGLPALDHGWTRGPFDSQESIRTRRGGRFLHGNPARGFARTAGGSSPGDGPEASPVEFPAGWLPAMPLRPPGS